MDEVAGQLPIADSVTKLPIVDTESDYDKAITMERKELLGLWGRGAINATTYVYMALKLDGYFAMDLGENKKFDLGAFCLRWTADESFTLTGKKPKELKHKQAIGALATLEEKGFGEMPSFGTCLKMHGV